MDEAPQSDGTKTAQRTLQAYVRERIAGDMAQRIERRVFQKKVTQKGKPDGRQTA